MKKLFCITLAGFLLSLVPLAQGADAFEMRGAQMLTARHHRHLTRVKKSIKKKHHKKGAKHPARKI